MGCRGSRLNPEQETIPARIQPLLRNRLDEIRRRRNPAALKGNTLSKKELLAKGTNYEDDDSSRSRRSAAGESDGSRSRYQSPRKSLEENYQSPMKSLAEETDYESTLDFDTRKSVSAAPEEGVAVDKEFVFRSCDRRVEEDEGEEEFLSFEPVAAAACCCDGVSDDNDKDKGVEEGKELDGGGMKDTRMDDQEDDGDERDMIYTCPASPSFRVYCRAQTSSDNEDNNDGHHIINDKLKVAQRQTSRISEEAESVDSNEVSVKAIKKRRKGIRFRKVIIIAKSAYSLRLLQKNIMKVSGCYTPLTSSKSSRLLQKAD